MDALSIVALIILITVILILAYGLIIIHDIPYKIALKRNHPHAEAIEAAGWVSLLLMHAIWPFLWIWAMLYKPEAGFGMGTPAPDRPKSGPTDDVLARLEKAESRLASLEQNQSGKPD